MDGDEEGTWIPPKTIEQEAVEKSRKTALIDTKRWIEEICGENFADPSDFRGSLRNGILLCEVLNKLKPGCVKRINRRQTPIAGLDNLSVFLATLQKEFGFSKIQLFDVKDLDDISEKFEGDALAAEDESRALKVAVTLCCLSEYCVTREATSPGAISSNFTGTVVKPIDSTLFISGTVIHRRQSLALSNDSDSLASSGYLTSGIPVRHNNDSGGGTSFDSLDDSRPSSVASGGIGGGIRFQKRDASDLAREAQRQMEVARMNRTMASAMRPAETNEDEWRSNLSDWREKRRRQNQGSNFRSPSLDTQCDEKQEEKVPENPKPFKKMVEESNKRRRSFNLLYPVEDEEAAVFDIPISREPQRQSSNTGSYSTSLPSSAPWAVDEPEHTIIPKAALRSQFQPSGNISFSSQNSRQHGNGTSDRAAPRAISPSDTSSSDNEACRRAAGCAQRNITIRLTRRPGNRGEKNFGLHLAEKNRAVMVERVVRGSTADINELRVGDRLVTIDGKPVSKVADALECLDRSLVQVCVRRTASDDDDLLDDMSDDDPPVAMRRPVSHDLSNRRSAPSMSTSDEAETPSLSSGPPSNLPPLRRVSSSSMSTASRSQNDEGLPSELNDLTDGSLQNAPMINGLLRAAKKGELAVEVRSDDRLGREASDDEDSNPTPTTHDPPAFGEPSPKPLSVRQRISTIESRNQFFGVKADSEEKKYKEIEKSSSRSLSSDDNLQESTHTAQALPWQRKQEFRPIRPRLGHYQKPQQEEREAKHAAEPEPASSVEDESTVAEDANELMVGMSKMRDDMARWRMRQETNEAEIESVLPSSRSGDSSSTPRSRDREVDEFTKPPSLSVKEQEMVDPQTIAVKDPQLEAGPHLPATGFPSPPPVRDSRARHAVHQPVSEADRPQPIGAAYKDTPSPPSASSKALTRHVETIESEIHKLEQLQLEQSKPEHQQTRHHFSNQAANSQSGVETDSKNTTTYSYNVDSNRGSASNRVSENSRQKSEFDDLIDERQPYLHKYLSGEHLKNQHPTQKESDVRLPTNTDPLPQHQQNQKQSFQKPTTAVITSPSYTEIQSRHPRSRTQRSGDDQEPTRPKSLITDRSSGAKHSLSSPQFAPSVRQSTSDTHLVSATSDDFPHPSFGQYHQRRMEEEDQAVKPVHMRPQKQSPPEDDQRTPTRSNVTQPYPYNVLEPQQQAYSYAPQRPQQQQQQPLPSYDQQQQRVSQVPQHQAPPYHTSHDDHYNQTYGNYQELKQTQNNQQQQSFPRSSQYPNSNRSEKPQQQHQQTRLVTSVSTTLSDSVSQPYEPSPVMSTSMYDFNRPPSHLTVMTQSAVDDSAIHPNNSRSQMALSPRQASSVMQQRHTIQRTHPASVPAAPSMGRMPNSHSVDSGLFHHMRSQTQAPAVSNPVYGSPNIHEPKRTHGHGHTPSQRHWLVDEALRRQQAEREGQRRKGPLAMGRPQEPAVEPKRQHQYQQSPRRDATPSDTPPALPPRIKSSNAMAAAMQRPRPVLNSRAPCCACNQPLGTGDLMTIESLRLSFHLTCFRCVACQTMLGTGRQDADVRVRGNRLYCFNCSALEEGMGGGGSLGRRGGGRY